MRNRVVSYKPMNARCRWKRTCPVIAAPALMLALGLSSCGGGRDKVEADQQVVTVGVAPVVKKTLSRQITLSSELVPFQ